MLIDAGGRGKARRSAPRGTLGETKPFDNSADLDRFTEWLRAFRGYYGRLFNKTYGAIDAKAVDCWIRTEFLVDDFNRCMGEFRASGGVTKNASDVEPLQLNPSSHTACERYYNASRRELVAGCVRGNGSRPQTTRGRGDAAADGPRSRRRHGRRRPATAATPRPYDPRSRRRPARIVRADVALPPQVVETERAFYETFLYRGCCDGNTTEPWATSILAPRETRP